MEGTLMVDRLNNSRPNSGLGELGGGAVSVPMAVAAFAMLVAIGLGIDGVRSVQGLANADAIAEEAARAAGQALDADALRRGSAAVEPAAAVAAARQHLAEAGADGSVTVVAPDRVRVEARITRPTVLLGLVGRSEITSVGAAESLMVPIAPLGGPR
jgi:Flp pilus assembly protein TadG